MTFWSKNNILQKIPHLRTTYDLISSINEIYMLTLVTYPKFKSIGLSISEIFNSKVFAKNSVIMYYL